MEPIRNIHKAKLRPQVKTHILAIKRGNGISPQDIRLHMCMVCVWEVTRQSRSLSPNTVQWSLKTYENCKENIYYTNIVNMHSSMCRAILWVRQGEISFIFELTTCTMYIVRTQCVQVPKIVSFKYEYSMLVSQKLQLPRLQLKYCNENINFRYIVKYVPIHVLCKIVLRLGEIPFKFVLTMRGSNPLDG